MNKSLQTIKEIERRKNNAYNLYLNYKKLLELIEYYNLKIVWQDEYSYKIIYKNKLFGDIEINFDGFSIYKYDKNQLEEGVQFYQLKAYISIWVRLIDIREKIKEEKDPIKDWRNLGLGPQKLDYIRDDY